MIGRAVLTTAALLTAYFLLPFTRPSGADTVPLMVLGLGLIVVLVAWQTREVLGSPWPRLRAVETLMTTAALFVLLFSTVYFVLGRSDPRSFTEPLTRTDSLYFTMTVFSTVGFGDIAPRTGTARLLATGQMIGDLLLIGVAFRVVVRASQEGMRRRARAPRTDGDDDGPTTSDEEI